MIKSVLPLSMIIALRFFGLFIVLSVLSGYAKDLPGGNAFLAGIALGGYALTQAVLQVPFGVMSDKIGRKKTLLVGLLIFALGSVVAGMADNIYMLLVGRFLQGAGAIGSVVTAMIADHVREDQRAHAMAIMGMVIAMSFAAAMLFGPIIAGYFSVSSLFWLTAILALTALLILFTAVPEPPKIIHHYSEEEAKIKHVFKDKDEIASADFNDAIAKVSIVGVGMKSHAGVAAKAFSTMADENINIRMISTSEIKVSMVIEEKYSELAVRSLHNAFELDK